MWHTHQYLKNINLFHQNHSMSSGHQNIWKKLSMKHWWKIKKTIRRIQFLNKIWNNRPLGHTLAIYKLTEAFIISVTYLYKKVFHLSKLCIKFVSSHFKKMSIKNVLSFFWAKLNSLHSNIHIKVWLKLAKLFWRRKFLNATYFFFYFNTVRWAKMD